MVGRAAALLGEADVEASFRKARRETASVRERGRQYGSQMALILPDNVVTLLGRLRQVDAENLTPMQALQLVEELSKLAKLG